MDQTVAGSTPAAGLTACVAQLAEHLDVPQGTLFPHLCRRFFWIEMRGHVYTVRRSRFVRSVSGRQTGTHRECAPPP